MDREAIAIELVPLSQLDDYDVVDGYPDIRGWPLVDESGREIGRITDLLVDRTRDEAVSAAVTLRGRGLRRTGRRVVQVPLAAMSVDEAEEAIRLTGPVEGL